MWLLLLPLPLLPLFLLANLVAVSWASGFSDFAYERGKDVSNYLGLPSPATVRTLQLDNGLVVCLVSYQNGALPAAVALDVLAGEFFEQQRGLASLVANSLLHSSPNYPTCDALSRHLKLSDHHLQVDVGATNVQYSFPVSKEDLPTVLSIFSSYFIAPFANPPHSCADHEPSSDTDDELNFCISNAARQQKGLRSQSQDLRSHSFHRLSQTRPDGDVAPEVREYFKHYYVASRMRLVICAPLLMEELTALARQHHFGTIPPKATVQQHRVKGHASHSQPTLRGERPQMPLFVVPVPVGAPRLQIHWRGSGASYISYILGEQVVDGLEALLRERLSPEWVAELQIHLDISHQATLEGIVLTIELTRDGVQVLPSVLENVFTALGRQRLDAALNPGRFHDYLRPASQKLPIDAARRLARFMHHAPALNLIQASLLPSSRLANIDFVADLLRAFSQNCTVILGGDIPVDVALQTRWGLEIFESRENKHIGTQHYLASLPPHIYRELERSSKASEDGTTLCQIS